MLCSIHSITVPLYLQQLQQQKEALATAQNFTLLEIADMLAIYNAVSAVVATQQKHLNTIKVVNPIIV